MKNNKKTENRNFGSVSVNFQFRAEVKKVTSQAMARASSALAHH